MLTIRLQRVGRKNDPSFRVVVTDSKNGPQSGKFKEILGSYNARFGKPILKTERIQHWLSVGAKTSETVHNMLVHYKVKEGQKINSLGPKPVVAAPEVKEEAPVVPAETAAPEIASEEAVAETKAEEAPVAAEEAPAPEAEPAASTETEATA